VGAGTIHSAHGAVLALPVLSPLSNSRRLSPIAEGFQAVRHPTEFNFPYFGSLGLQLQIVLVADTFGILPPVLDFEDPVRHIQFRRQPERVQKLAIHFLEIPFFLHRFCIEVFHFQTAGSPLSATIIASSLLLQAVSSIDGFPSRWTVTCSNRSMAVLFTTSFQL